jgi:hypothetical protein
LRGKVLSRLKRYSVNSKTTMLIIFKRRSIHFRFSYTSKTGKGSGSPSNLNGDPEQFERFIKRGASN